MYAIGYLEALWLPLLKMLIVVCDYNLLIVLDLGENSAFTKITRFCKQYKFFAKVRKCVTIEKLRFVPRDVVLTRTSLIAGPDPESLRSRRG